jgi:hypothetical protein
MATSKASGRVLLELLLSADTRTALGIGKITDRHRVNDSD